MSALYICIQGKFLTFKQMESTLIHSINPNEIIALFEGLKNQINELNQKFEPKQPTEYLTRIEVSDLLKCDLSTIWAWQKKSKLIPYGIGNRVYFKRSEIEAALVCLNKKRGASNHE